MKTYEATWIYLKNKNETKTWVKMFSKEKKAKRWLAKRISRYLAVDYTDDYKTLKLDLESESYEIRSKVRFKLEKVKSYA